MEKAVVIFGSTTGTTEMAAKWVKEALLEADVKTDILNAADIQAAPAAQYDLIVFGSSTWGEGDIQEDFIGVYDGLTVEMLKDKKVAVFGCGDSDMFPDNFCQAVDKIVEKAKECEADILGEPFKIDGDVDAYEEKIQEWAKGLI